MFSQLLGVQMLRQVIIILNATTNDGSCEFIINGCTDTNAVNYNSFANVLDESCLYTGCTDLFASNYNSQANIDDGSCYFDIVGCTDSLGLLMMQTNSKHL